MRDVSLAWAGGLFTGEGTVRIAKPTKRNQAYLVCSMVNTERELVEQFNEWWPGYMKPATGLRPDQKPAWVWNVAARKAEVFLVAVLPYLGERMWTRAQWGLMFQAQKTRDQTINRTATYIQRQWSFYDAMKVMNKRGNPICPKADEFRRGK